MKKGVSVMTDKELTNSTNITRDEDLDLTSMLNAVKEESNVVKKEEVRIMTIKLIMVLRRISFITMKEWLILKKRLITTILLFLKEVKLFL